MSDLPDSPRRDDAASTSKELDRILTFSDGVFAIAITLLAFNVDIPDVARDSLRTDLPHRLLLLVPNLISFTISFGVIGIYWVEHHRIFRHIRRYDNNLLWLNLLLLFFIVVLPFPTELLGTYGNERLAVIFYAGCLALTGLAQTLLWWYAAGRRRLVDSTLDSRYIRYLSVRTAAPPVIFLTSIPLAYAHLRVAEIAWAFLLLAQLVIPRRYHVTPD
jgi:uncharacterized membrane protein